MHPAGVLGFAVLVVVAAFGKGICADGTSGHGGVYPRPQRLPSFSWDTLGGMTFAHLYSLTPLTTSQAAFLTRFKMVTFEKRTGNREVGWAEDKMAAAAAAVKAINSSVVTLRYINTLLDFTGHETNFSLHDKAAAAGCLWPSFHGGLLTFDLNATAMINLLVQECNSAVTRKVTPANVPAFDGCFLDRANFGLEMLRDYQATGKTPRGFTPAMVQGLAKGGPTLLQALQEHIGDSGGLLVAKEHGSRAGYDDGKYVNGLMFNDGLCSDYAKAKAPYDPNKCLAQLEAVLLAAQRGQLVQARTMAPLAEAVEDFVSAPMPATETEQQTFLVACFLAVASNTTYFAFADNGDGSYAFAHTPWLAAYDKPLGEPLGPATRTGPNGTHFHRSFRCGTTVDVDLLTKKTTIAWGKGC
eukprot:m.489896 g.489896  ORF g.489896 m.489896 type:complete len:413 (-) comp27246_c0_seq1:88-1326(-)